MFKNLDQVNWTKHKGAFHLTARLPGYVRQMTAEDEQKRREARDTVFEEIFHQGSIYGATPHVVPFLIEMLAEESVPDKGELICQLWQLVISCERGLGHGSPIGGRESRLYMATYQNIAAGYAVYLRLLAHPDPFTRFWDTLLLSSLFEYAPRTRCVLRRQAAVETEARAKASTIYQIGKLAPKGYRRATKVRTQYQAYLAEWMADSNPRLVQLAAASAWVLIQQHYIPSVPETIPPRLIPVLAEALCDPIAVDEQEYFIEFLPDYAIIETCSKLGIHRLAELIQVPQMSAYHVHCLAREMLDRVFARAYTNSMQFIDHYWAWGVFGGWKRKEPPKNMIYQLAFRLGLYSPPEALTDAQRTVLAAIVDQDCFWLLPTNLFSFFYGLPDDREKLRALVAI
jgi:hypothetical protein